MDGTIRPPTTTVAARDLPANGFDDWTVDDDDGTGSGWRHLRGLVGDGCTDDQWGGVSCTNDDDVDIPFRALEGAGEGYDDDIMPFPMITDGTGIESGNAAHEHVEDSIDDVVSDDGGAAGLAGGLRRRVEEGGAGSARAMHEQGSDDDDDGVPFLPLRDLEGAESGGSMPESSAGWLDDVLKVGSDDGAGGLRRNLEEDYDGYDDDGLYHRALRNDHAREQKTLAASTNAVRAEKVEGKAATRRTLVSRHLRGQR